MFICSLLLVSFLFTCSFTSNTDDLDDIDDWDKFVESFMEGDFSVDPYTVAIIDGSPAPSISLADETRVHDGIESQIIPIHGASGFMDSSDAQII